MRRAVFALPLVLAPLISSCATASQERGLADAAPVPSPTTPVPSPSAASPLSVASAPSPNPSASAAPLSRTEEAVVFLVYFPDQQHPDWDRSCGAVTAVERKLPSPELTPTNVARQVLAGPTPREQERGLSDPYREPYGAAEPAGPSRLGDYFVGARVEGRRATLEFTGEGLRWLNAAACLQDAVKVPLERTLREKYGVDTIDYVIDGKPFDDWDA